jgi:hypothetical protein
MSKRNALVFVTSSLAMCFLAGCTLSTPAVNSQTDAGQTADASISMDGSKEDPWADPATTPVQIGATRPMTCTWIDSSNCWVAALEELQAACVPGGIGSVSASNPKEILYPSGMKALSKDLYESQFNAPSYRYFLADGKPCGAIRIQYGFRTTVTIEVGGRVVFGNLGGAAVTLSRVVCSDGTTYAENEAGGNYCDGYRDREFQSRVPAIYGTCNEGACGVVLAGSKAGRIDFATYKR